MHKILFVTNVLSPYRADFFSEWGKSCKLTVIATQDNIKSRDKKWKPALFDNYECIFLHARPFRHDDTSLSFHLVRYLMRYGAEFDYIIFGVYVDPTEILGILYCQLMHYPYIISDDGSFFTDSMVGIKRRLLRGSKLCLTTSQVGKSTFEKLGIPEDQIKIYPFSSIHDSQIVSLEKRRELQKKCRGELNLSAKKILLCVSQFIPGKGIDVLLRALSKDDADDMDVYIIGGIATPEYKKIVEVRGLTNVHFCSFMLPDELDKYYKAADCFVLPTRRDVWGLVLNEAMARGLPVITTDMCLAGREMIKDGINGYVVPADNENKLRGAILKIILDDELRRRMGKKSLEIAKKYTIETMVDAYQKRIDNLLNYRH